MKKLSPSEQAQQQRIEGILSGKVHRKTDFRRELSWRTNGEPVVEDDKSKRLKRSDIEPLLFAPKVEKKKGRRSNGKPPFAPAQRLFLRKLYGDACLRCGSREELNIDHIVPYDWTQDHSFNNWQVLCWECNRAKATFYACDFRYLYFLT